MIYLTGSLRHPRVLAVAQALRAMRVEVFDDWYAAGPRADDHWQEYEQQRGRTFLEALRGKASRQVVGFDRTNLDACSACVLVMPCGKSGHLELGYVLGQRKPGYILLEHEPERWDQMYGLATKVFYHIPDLVEELA